MKPPTCHRCGVPFANSINACACPLFHTITSEDWRRSLTLARKRRAQAPQRLKQQINPKQI